MVTSVYGVTQIKGAPGLVLDTGQRPWGERISHSRSPQAISRLSGHESGSAGSQTELKGISCESKLIKEITLIALKKLVDISPETVAHP